MSDYDRIMDIITIKDLEVMTHIGVPDEERTQEQRLLLTVDMHLDTRKAAENDDVTMTVDYDRVCCDLRELAKQERKTVERFAEDAAGLILKGYSIESVIVTVKKFIIPDTEHISLTITRP